MRAEGRPSPKQAAKESTPLRPPNALAQADKPRVATQNKRIMGSTAPPHICPTSVECAPQGPCGRMPTKHGKHAYTQNKEPTATVAIYTLVATLGGGTNLGKLTHQRPVAPLYAQGRNADCERPKTHIHKATGTEATRIESWVRQQIPRRHLDQEYSPQDAPHDQLQIHQDTPPTRRLQPRHGIP